MRELKFRVWDKEAGEYLEGEEDKAFVLKLDGTHYVEMTFGYYNKGKDWVIEQFTGLKDKNGKEIYEGDIVENTYEDVGKVRYEVRWDCGRFIMESRKPVNLVQIGMGIYPHSSEVIGNIHENQELVEGKK
jgi:uncharacterized phage protein (TIGR01671 family)